MKHFFLVLAITVFFNNVFSKTLNEKNVPVAVKAAFHRAHPNNFDISWTQQGSDYKVEYDINKVDMSNTYEASGKLVNSESDIEIWTLPAVILKYVKINYNQTSVNQAFKIRDSSGVITYKADINGKSLFFDLAGDFIKEVKK